MLGRFINVIVPSLFLLSILLSCKEELVIEQKKENNTSAQATLAKKSDLSSVQADSIIQKEKKEKVKRLKKEHEKPYVVIEKPEKLLQDKLKSRASNNTSSKILNKSGLNSVQSSLSCYTMEVDVWVLEKYHSKSGFNVGVRPKDTWMYNSSILTTLKDTWAFNLIMLPRMAFASPIVYPDNQIVADVRFNLPQAVFDSYSTFLSEPGRLQLYAFYCDEPWHYINPYNRDSISRCVNGLKAFGFTSTKYIAGETCDGWADNFDDLVDFVDQTEYRDMSYIYSYGCLHMPWDEDDQRDEWTDFNNAFGSKFNHLWISGELDRGEMDLLTGHAQNMGKNSIWMYAGQSYIPDQSYWDAIAEFDYYAYVHGFLRREERRFIYVYYYIGYDDPCFDYQITSWELVDIIDTGETVIR